LLDPAKRGPQWVELGGGGAVFALRENPLEKVKEKKQIRKILSIKSSNALQ